MRLDARQMRAWALRAAEWTDDHGRATPEGQAQVHEVERGDLTDGARVILQAFAARAGVKLAGPIAMPVDDTPLWLAGPHPLANHQSKPKLPRTADVAIIGAGLTGGSAAYHLARGIKQRGLRVIVLDAADPATGASGKNGGNFELIPESFHGAYGTYDGLEGERLKFLQAGYPGAPDDVLRAQARRIAITVLRFGHENAREMARTIAREKIDCDLSPAGWLRTALNDREAKAFEAEADLAGSIGAKIEILSGQTIEKRYHFPAEHPGRMVPGNGNYHPFKLVIGELERALARGVELYTRTKVLAVRSRTEHDHRIETTRGIVRARRVIVATNAFTSEIFPELGDVRYFRSQIASYAHVEDHLHGISVTAKDGDIYANFPASTRYLDAAKQARGTLLVGGGTDVEDVDPWRPRPSRAVFEHSLHEVAIHFPGAASQPPTALWAGPMAFVEGARGMRLPLLGPLGDGPKRGVFIAIWCNGYGGTGCHLAGKGAASWALTGRVPRNMPADVFGPARLFTDELQLPSRGRPSRARA